MAFPLISTIIAAKGIQLAAKTLNLGAGSTWPGEIALRLTPNVLNQLEKTLTKGVVLVVGTNGKTTTTLMINNVLEQAGFRVIHNASGANLLNGLVSAFIENADWQGKIQADWGVFEVDENSLPIVLQFIKPRVIVLLNLFRDQLDRYGEVDTIVEKWVITLSKNTQESLIVANSDDPLVTFISRKISSPKLYFGVSEKKYFQKSKEHASDSIFCLNCGKRLRYEGIYYSHIGIWGCSQCGEKRPDPDLWYWKSPLPGLYNLYNTLAAVSVLRHLLVPDKIINKGLINFKPAFGRQEEFNFYGKKVQMFLSKNPAGFNASLRTVIDLQPKAILLVLNDRIPDGRDVSWIWDVDFEMLPNGIPLVVSGDRVYDLALRLKYAGKSGLSTVEPNLKEALEKSFSSTASSDTLYILPTYSAMLDCRKILIGKRIL